MDSKSVHLLVLKQSAILHATPSITHSPPQTKFFFLTLWWGLDVKPTHTDANGCNWFSDTKNRLVERAVSEHSACRVCRRVLMYVYPRMPVCACARDALFLYSVCVCVCVWERCSGDSEQRGLRESLLTGSDGKLWNGNKASCHYSTNSLSRTRWYTARQQWLQTNEQITSPSSPSLADWTQIVMRDMRSEQRIVLNAYKYRCH